MQEFPSTRPPHFGADARDFVLHLKIRMKIKFVIIEGVNFFVEIYSRHAMHPKTPLYKVILESTQNAP